MNDLENDLGTCQDVNVGGGSGSRRGGADVAARVPRPGVLNEQRTQRLLTFFRQNADPTPG